MRPSPSQEEWGPMGAAQKCARHAFDARCAKLVKHKAHHERPPEVEEDS